MALSIYNLVSVPSRRRTMAAEALQRSVAFTVFFQSALAAMFYEADEVFKL